MASEDHQSLTLGLGFSSPSTPNYINHPLNLNTPKQPPLLRVADHDGDHQAPSLTLSLSGDTYQRPPPERKPEEPPCSATSSLSNTAANAVVSVKRERESASSDDLEAERNCNYSISRGSDEEEEGSGPTTASTRKKLRLTKEQSALLEESFKQHSTLNPKQKQALADRLNLRSRQVEVWFQNRRARTKLKQTEVDCEYLKKCCETLTDENRRLQKELQELKALKMGAAGQPLYMHLPAATLTMCPSCERIGAGVPITAGAPASKTPFIAMAAKPPFYTSFTNSSAAC